MKRAVICFAACSVFVFAASATLPAAELTHRWSFNGDWSDSVGGADAVKCGSYVSLYGNRVHMGYGSCTHGSGYVSLGTNMLDTTAATIEIWARHDGVQNWSRIFDYGADNTHYFQMPWTNGTNLNKDSIGAKNGGGETQAVDTMAPYEIGTDYYIAATFQRSGDATVVRWQRRDAATGELQKSGTLTMTVGIHEFVDPVLYLGHSQYTADKDALAAYDEVRLWSGVLTDAQLAASAAAGPDATITADSGVPQFAAAPTPEPPERRAAMSGGGFRLMTYNIQYCYDEVNTIIPDRTAARIIAENPDFCCVNEVRDSAGHPEATMLAKLTGMHKNFGGNESGSNGNLILSKEEPLGTETLFLKMSDQGWSDRYCLICEFTNFCVAVTHLDTRRDSNCDFSTVQASNAVAIATIRDAFAKYTKPVFLCGDWNTRPNYDNMARFNEFLEILSPTNGVRTYHGHKTTGGSVIDYIAVDTAHADNLYVANSFVVDDIATSDHNPVIAELYCRPAASTLGWIDESFLTTGRTGAWSPAAAWDAGSWTAELAGENVFTPGSPSGGNVVTMTVTASFDAVPMEEATPDETAQGAVWLGTKGCFQMWTKELKVEGGELKVGRDAAWLDVEAEGVTPAPGVEYTFRVVFDYTAGTYSVGVQDGTEWRSLVGRDDPIAPQTDFPLAAPGTSIAKIRFNGDGVLRSITGEYVVAEGFSADEAIVLKGNASVILDAAKAAWLNSCAGGKTAVGTAAAGLSAADFDAAYLLNLDITDEDRSYAFEVTDVAVGEDAVVVTVTLTRQGAIAAPVNGRLKFYGAATLEAFRTAAARAIDATLSDDDFSDGETATATIPKSGGDIFFKATIE